MKYIMCCLMVVLMCSHLDAQTLTGVVYDKATEQPIPNVQVYLDGTTINGITNSSGRFELTVKNILNTKLVLRHTSYQIAIIENPFTYLPEKIYLEEQLNVLNEVTVVADRFSREQKLKAFREQFLGMTRAGRSCKIINESDIQIWYNTQTNTLMASSNQPIVVVNEYLGYEILLNLIDFQVEYLNLQAIEALQGNIPGNTWLNDNNILKSYFAVTSSFTDISPDNRSIKRRRDEAYDRSSTFFFRSFSNNTLKESGFRIYKDKYQIDPHVYFTTKDTLSQKMIRLIPDSFQTAPSIDKPKLVDVRATNIDKSLLAAISVLYRRVQSDIYFYTDNLLVDQYGNIDQIDKVLFSGLMGQYRVGNMLPIEYEP